MAEIKVTDQSMKEAFDLHDHQGKQKIASAELGNALRSVGKRLTHDAVKKLVQKADSEHGGQLDFETFKTFVKLAGDVEKRDEDLKQAFLVFDNGSGKGVVDMKAFKHAISTLGDKLTEQEIQTFFKDAGFDDRKEDNITYEKFVKLLQTN